LLTVHADNEGSIRILLSLKYRFKGNFSAPAPVHCHPSAPPHEKGGEKFS